MADKINPEYIVTGLDETFSNNDIVIPENVGYYSIDKQEMRVGNGTDKWSDLVPFIYSERAINIINDWSAAGQSNVPSSLIVKNRLEILEKVSGEHSVSIIDHTTRITNLEKNKAPTNHASSSNMYGIGTSGNYGHVKLSIKTNDKTLDVSKGTAATPSAVAAVNDIATDAYNISIAAMPKSGNSTFTGPVDNTTYYSCSGTDPYYKIVSTGIEKGVKPGALTTTTGFRITDSKGQLLSTFANVYNTNQDNRTDIIAYRGKGDITGYNRISIGYNSSGNVYTYAPTPAAKDNSTQIATTAFVNSAIKSNAVPVGTIISYWGNSAPSGYLICDGRSIDESKYPLLYKQCGGYTPNLENYFLRGANSTYGVGYTEEDAGRNITGTYDAYELSRWDVGCSTTGAFFGTVGGYRGTSDHDGSSIKINFDASRVWGAKHTTDSTTGEFRPKNKRVLFCIKHDE